MLQLENQCFLPWLYIYIYIYLVELIIFLLTQGCDKHSFNKSYRLVKSLLVSSTATWSNRIFTVWFAFYCLVMFKKKPPFSQLPRQKAQWPTEEDQYYILKC